MVKALDSGLCSPARHFTFTGLLLTQKYKILMGPAALLGQPNKNAGKICNAYRLASLTEEVRIRLVALVQCYKNWSKHQHCGSLEFYV